MLLLLNLFQNETAGNSTLPDLDDGELLAFLKKQKRFEDLKKKREQERKADPEDNQEDIKNDL